MGQLALEVVLIHHTRYLLAAGGTTVVESRCLVHANEDHVPSRAAEYPLSLTCRVPLAASCGLVGVNPRQVLPINVYRKKPFSPSSPFMPNKLAVSTLLQACKLSRSNTAISRVIPPLGVVEVDIGDHVTEEVGVTDLGGEVVCNHLLVGGVKPVPEKKRQLQLLQP